MEATIDHVLTAKTLSVQDRVQVIEDSLGGAVAAKAAWPQITSLENISHKMADINVPTLIITGELDRVDPPIKMRTEVLSRLPGAAMRVIAETGHLSMLESPEEVASLIEEFCDRLKLGALTEKGDSK